MATLPTDADSTPNYTAAQHATHHNTLAGMYNGADGNGGLFVPVFVKSGQYFTQPGSTTTWAIGASLGYMRGGPILVPRSLTVDRIGLEVTTSAATAVVRLGIWNADADGRPTSLVLDAGTIDGSSTGVKEITISQALSAGVYVVSAVGQTAGCTVRATTATSVWYSAGSNALSSNQNGGVETSGSATPGALPGTYPAVAVFSMPAIPRVLLRAA